MKVLAKYLLDTTVHKLHVARFMSSIAGRLLWRAVVHDLSKYGKTEREIYARVTPLFKEHPYGSEGYKDVVAQLGPALEHHYAANRHHPEHFSVRKDTADTGMGHMNVIDAVEMLCDWKAASMRRKNVDFLEQLKEQRKDRDCEYRSIADLRKVLERTAKDLGW